MKKTIFITGGTSGIGLDLAKFYLASGYEVGVCGRSRERFDDNFKGQTGGVNFYQVDVSDRELLRQSVLNFVQKFKRLDIMIANAGIGFSKKTKIPDFNHSYKMVHINLLGAMYSFEVALEIMIPQGFGHLVGISSLAAYNGMPGASAYSATKSALLKYCESLHLDLKKLHIDVTCICPGFIDTPLTQANHHPMPFLMDSPLAAQKIAKAIERKKLIYSFPFVTFFVVKFLSMLPRTLYRSIMTFKLLNYSKER